MMDTPLDKFRVRVIDLNLNDKVLLRFLTARQGNIDKAEEMIRKSMEWRKLNNIEEYRRWKPAPEFLQEYPFQMIGTDKDGYPVMYLPMGKWDAIKGFQRGWKETMYRYKVYILEKILLHVEQSLRDKFVIIVDMAQFSYRVATHYESVRLTVTGCVDFEANYCETLHKAYVIRASWAFPIFFACIKPLCTGTTLGKVQIFAGDNDERWKPYLQESIPQSVIDKI